ncbi:hypothetical protein D3C72_2502850 [compost metagenome]
MYSRLVSGVIRESMNIQKVIMLRPVMAKGRAPILSKSLPPMGIIKPEASAWGSITRPVFSGL